jgi:hypothetical protein
MLEGQISTDTVTETTGLEVSQNAATTPAIETQNTETATPATDILSANPAAPAYSPNYKFKVHGEEREFDDWAKGLVKSADDEKKYREIMEKIHGIEHIKQDREKLRGELTPLQETAQKYTSITKNLDKLSQYVRTGNYEAFFQELDIPEEEVLHYAARRVQYREMSPEQRASYDRNVQAQREAVTYGQQNQDLQVQMHTLQHQQRMFELDQYLTSPGIKEIVQEYDSGRQAGAFKQLVQDRGVYHYMTSKKDLPATDVVSEIMQILGRTPQTQTTSAQMSNPQVAPTQAQPKAPEKKPVIPAVDGGGASPARQPIKSMDDIRKIREGFASN